MFAGVLDERGGTTFRLNISKGNPQGARPEGSVTEGGQSLEPGSR